MRLAFFGDAAATGFGTVTRDLGRAFLDLGVDVRFVSQNEVGDLEEPFRSRTLEATTFLLGRDGIEGVSATIPDLITGSSQAPMANGEPWGEWKPDALFLLGDFSSVRAVMGQHADALKTIPAWHYCPVEGHDLPPNWKLMWDVVRPIAMSKFGQTEMAKVIGYLPPLMYHGVDTDTFYPVSPERPIVIEGKDDAPDVTLRTKAHCRQFFTNGPLDPKKVWILRTDRYMPRKAYNLLLRIMSPLLEQHPNVDLILHCRAMDQGGYLPDSISKLPEAVQEQVILTQLQGIPRPVLNALYNAADIYVSTSSEGFGLTVAEAIACGVPVVGIDYSAVPEVIGPAGITVPVGQVFDNEYNHVWATPDPEKFRIAVEYLITHASRRRALGAMGPGHVRKTFSWAKAADVFLTAASPFVMEDAA